MNEAFVPTQPKNSYRITVDLLSSAPRLDNVLLQALKNQDDNHRLRIITRSALKNLFLDKKITIKGQNAKPSSGLAKGITHIDIKGY